MEIKGAVILLTGANGGIGRALAEVLLAAGAARIYAGARDPAQLDDMVTAADGRIIPLTLDVTRDGDVEAAAKTAADVTILINNAGVNFNTRLIAEPTMANAEHEVTVNYLGTLRVTRAFAPVLKANGGGCIVNMVSILARVNLPTMGSLCASKAALLSMTQGVRAELAGQGTRVIGVLPGAVETRLTAHLDIPKMTPQACAEAVVAAIEADEEDVYPGDMARGVLAGLGSDPKAVEKEFAAAVAGNS